MAITCRNGVLASTGANATSITVSQPTGTVNDDFMLAFIMDKATSGSSAAPAGWTWLCGAAGASGRLQVFYAIKGWSTSLPVATSWTFTGLIARCAGRIISYVNANHNALTGTATARYNASGTYGTTTLTTGVNNAMIVGGFLAFGATPTWSAETCATSGALSEASGFGAADSAYSTYFNIAFAAAILATAGATGASSATPSAAAINAAALLALAPATAPAVTTEAVTNIATTTATGNGTVTGDGGSIISERGIAWNTATAPTKANYYATSAGTTGSYTAPIASLTQGTLYYVRAYSINAQGTTYGNEVTFTTKAIYDVSVSFAGTSAFNDARNAVMPEAATLPGTSAYAVSRLLSAVDSLALAVASGLDQAEVLSVAKALTMEALSGLDISEEFIPGGFTYDDFVTMATSAVINAACARAISKDVILTSGTSLGVNEQEHIPRTLILGSTSGLTGDRSVVAPEATTLASASAIVAARSEIIAKALALTVSSGFTDSALGQFGKALGLAATSGLSSADVIQTARTLAMAATSGLSMDNYVEQIGIVVGILTMAASSGLSQAAMGQLAASLSMLASANMTLQGGALIGKGIELGITADLSSQVVGAFSKTLTLLGSAAFSGTAQWHGNKGVALDGSADLFVTYGAVSQYAVSALMAVAATANFEMLLQRSGVLLLSVSAKRGLTIESTLYQNVPDGAFPLNVTSGRSLTGIEDPIPASEPIIPDWVSLGDVL